MRDRLFHHAGRFHHLRQEHFAFAKQITDHIHAIHQRAFDHLDRTIRRQAAFFGIFVNELGNAMHQRMSEPLIYRQFTPLQIFLALFAVAFELLGDFQQALGRIGTTIEHHIFDAFLQHRI